MFILYDWNAEASGGASAKTCCEGTVAPNATEVRHLPEFLAEGARDRGALQDRAEARAVYGDGQRLLFVFVFAERVRAGEGRRDESEFHAGSKYLCIRD